jgi:hypothetical protein
MTYEGRTWSPTQTKIDREDTQRFDWEGGTANRTEDSMDTKSRWTDDQAAISEQSLRRILPTVIGVAIAGYAVYRVVQSARSSPRTHVAAQWSDRLTRGTDRLKRGLPEAGHAVDQIVGGLTSLLRTIRPLVGNR